MIAGCQLPVADWWMWLIKRRGRVDKSVEIQRKTKKFALKIIELVDELPNDYVLRVIKGQMLRSGTSVAANYRAVCRARTKPDFINKMGVVEEEADETRFWLELLEESGRIKKERISEWYKEASQILAIAVASLKTAKKNRKKR